MAQPPRAWRHLVARRAA